MAEETARTPDKTKADDRPSRENLRVEAAERYGDRRRAEPAAAPYEADAEAGAQSPDEGKAPPRQTPRPRGEPASTFAVNSEGVAFPDRPDDGADQRAGPGDAGKQLHPTLLESAQQSPRPKSSSYLLMILLALGAVLLSILAAMVF